MVTEIEIRNQKIMIELVKTLQDISTTLKGIKGELEFSNDIKDKRKNDITN